MHNDNDDVFLGSGKSPEGAEVAFYEVYRPSTIGAIGSTGLIVEARDAKSGQRIIHSDTIEGLKSVGYIFEVPAKTLPPADETPKLRKDVPLTKVEEDEIRTFRGQLNEVQAKDFDAWMESYGNEPMRPMSEIMAEFDSCFPLTSAPGTEPTRVPVPASAPAAEVKKELSIEEQLG